MSRSLRRGSRTRVLVAAVLAGSALAAVHAAPADAAFTTGKCLGDNIIGDGASFAKAAQQQVFIPLGLPSFCASVGSNPSVTYNANGSGSGRRVVGERTSGASSGLPDNTTGSHSRDQPARFGASDEPMKPTGQAQINAGTDATGDEGLIHTIPLAVGGNAVPVNVPDGCTISKNPDGTALDSSQLLRFSDSADPTKRRLHLTRDEIEKIFNGGTEYDTWGKLVSWINDGNGTASQAGDTHCSTFPLVRVRRLDDGGTTFAQKAYLDSVNPARGWATTYTTPDTRTWPNSSRTVAFDYNNDGDTSDAVTKCAAQFAPFNATTCNEDAVPLLQTTEVTGTAGNGNGPLVDKVNDFDGSIGYGDLATVRQRKSFAFVRSTADDTSGSPDDKYWVQLQNKNLTSYGDPAIGATGFQSTAATGSTCVNAALRNVPTGTDPTLGDWEATSMADSTQTSYGICTLTYGLAFDDYSGPYSAQADQAAEERKARSVRDHFEAAVTAGQNFLTGQDYAPLPVSVQAIALTGVQAIGWGKVSVTPPVDTCPSGQTGTPPNCTLPPSTKCPTGQTGTPPNCITPTPIVTPPSNAFTITSARVKSGNIALSIRVPGKGAVRATGTATYKKKKVSVGSAASSVSAGATVKLTLKPSSKAKAALKKSSLKVTVSVTYTPTGGKENTVKKTVTIKKTVKKKKKGK